ncbi:SRPBCC domain-containing protein [Seongchinamella unica]|uniref:SRPBCC domain-containing protein n=1 Tax=Seongchinamella unica TaxID=2547392 RepID=A0A4R5LSU0_9GAMM|nr:SRPBCC domain-containing protein [Seongchinamella unica]TDG13950.1 SRPBCC domain-containing protein [Seongchinamella unica]
MSDTIRISSDTVEIEAPAELVWQVIVDFAQYPHWNEFCPAIEAELEIGSPVKMQVNLGEGLQEQVEYITCIEAPHRITWSMENKPGDPVHADRSQLVTALDGHRCSYVTYDDFSGDFAAAMVEQLGERVRQGFNLCARNLKARAESLHQDA